MRYILFILLFASFNILAQGNRIDLSNRLEKFKIATVAQDSGFITTNVNGEQIYITNQQARARLGVDTISGGGGDDWGTQVVETDGTLVGDGTTGNELAIDSSEWLTVYRAEQDFILNSDKVIPPIILTWDGQGATVTTGNTIYRQIAYAGTITGWSIVATGVSPTTTIDIWKVATGTTLPTVANTIMGTKPALATGNALRSTTMTGWTTLAIAEGDIIGFNIDACSNATTIRYTLELN